MDKYIKLALGAITHFFKAKGILEPPENLPAEMLSRKAGVFVSLHKKSDHALRGCIGTFRPTQNSIAKEIVQNALSAAFDDPRFSPVRENELNDLDINVDVLSEPEPIEDKTSLDPIKFGLIVKNQNGQAGLLLPDIGVNSVDEQIAICCEKGGISPMTDQLSFFRFTVERHK